MSIKLIIARHGNTFGPNETAYMVGKKTDLSLVDKGRLQASELGKHFLQNKIKFDAIFTGRLKRQTEFAEIVKKELADYQNIRISEALDEIDYGSWEGLSTANLSKNFESKYEAWTKRGVWPDSFAETEAYKTEILLNWINCIRSQFDNNQNILAISSNGVIRLLAKFSDIACGETIWSRLSENNSIDNLKLATGAYSEIEITSLGLNIDLKRWNLKPQ